jgi:isomerase DpgB
MERLNMNIEDTASISVELIEKINQLCAQAEADEQVKVVGFTFGKTSGADAGEAIADVALLHKWEKSLRRLENVNALIVAHCEGELSLAAMSILAVSDLRIGTPASSFGLNGKDANGLRSLLLLGNRWSAEEAEANGLLDRLASQPQALTEDIIFGLNPHAFNDIRVRRKLILEASTASYDETLGLSLSASDRIMRKG